jgi:hypothetical protein
MKRRTLGALGGATALMAGTLAFLVAPAAALNPPLASWDPVGSGVVQLNNNAPNGANPTTIPTSPASDAFDHVWCQATNPTCATPTVALGGAGAVAFDHSAPAAFNFTVSSKDPGDINTWSWKSTGGLPGKDALLDSSAARYAAPVGPGGSANLQTCPLGTGVTGTKCSLLYFASDRFDNSGDAQQGFWFFQNSVFAASNGTFEQTNPDGSVSPAVHRVGDILIVSDFSIGGTTSTIDVYEWVGTGGDTNGTLQFLSGGTSEECSLVPAPSPLCGQVNTGTANIASPWPFSDKTGSTSFRTGEFYNGGINLSQFPALAKECFGSFTAESRSSTSPTATLKSFIIGSFAKCGSTTTSTPQDSLGNPIPPTGLSIGGGTVTVQDSATVNATGSAVPPTGSVDFHVCGSPATTCPSGSGVDVGTTALNGTSNPSTVTSPPVVISAAGTYCFRADYLGDANYPKSSDGSSDECFTINPVTAAVTTTASTGPVSLGTAIDDTAHLTGTANEPGTPVINPTTPGGAAKGTITFNLYGPNDTTCATSIEKSVVNVSGNGDYNASTGTLSGTLGSLTPKAAGTYLWIANYSGDPPNTLANPANGCNGANESVVVNPNQPAISTQGTCATGCPVGTPLDDTATLSGTFPEPDGITPAKGTITFKLFAPGDTTCSGTPVASSVVPVSGDGSYKASSGTVTGTLTPSLPGTYQWTASYSGDPPNTLGVTEGCGGTNEASLLIQLNPTIATDQSFVPNDKAEIKVGTGAGNLAGSVEFQLYVNSPTCANAAVYDKSFPVSGSTDFTQSTDNTTSYSTNGTTFSWKVTYTSTNPGHTGVTSSCNSENSMLTINGNA